MSSLKAISSLLIEPPSRKINASGDLYQLLANKRASEHCNDASLCLRDIDATYEAIHPDDRDDDLRNLAAFAVSSCSTFLDNVLKGIKGRKLLLTVRSAQVTGNYADESIRSISAAAFAVPEGQPHWNADIQLFLRHFNSSFTFTRGRARLRAVVSELSRLFFLLAIAFEAEQGRLISRPPDVRTQAHPAQQHLVLDFSRISLGC